MKLLEIILLATGGIGTLLMTLKWKSINWTKRIIAIVVIASVIVTAVNKIKANNKQELLDKINAKLGDITSDKGATIPKLQIGESGVIFVLGESGVFDYPPVGKIFRVYEKNNKLFFSGVIRDRNGHTIAAILENSWKMYSGDYEYNNNDNAFEIVTNDEKKVYFQIELVNGIAKMSGMLLNDKGVGVYFLPDPPQAALMCKS
jgi:hypothetical protein